MMVFVGPHVKATGLHDGVTSRVMSIDALFSDKEKIYFDIHFFGFLQKKVIVCNNTKIIKCNYFLHIFFIMRLLFAAETVYIHTMMNYLRVFPYVLFKHKTIVDIHGVLVDELKYNNAPKWKVALYQCIEYLIMRYSYRIICVTEKMKNYYIDKYNISAQRILVLPIFSQDVDLNLIRRKRYDMKSVIYAGNLDKWQCIDKMLEIASEATQYNYQFLVSDLNRFQDILSKYKISNLQYNSVPKPKVYDYYKKATFGFIIRDNNILNQVSCPTKLVEYICNGIIPITNGFQLGDFFNLHYITVQDFFTGKIPNEDSLRRMALLNAKLYKSIYHKSVNSSKTIRNL